MIYAINYDLKKQGQDYKGLYEAIKSCGAWWHFLDSCWLVDTNLVGQAIFTRLRNHIDANDSLLVIRVKKDYTGWLPQEAWDWIAERQYQLAA